MCDIYAMVLPPIYKYFMNNYILIQCTTMIVGI